MATSAGPHHGCESYREDGAYRVRAAVDAVPGVDVRWIDGRPHVIVEHHESGHTRV